jgi:hypothetical protein
VKYRLSGSIGASLVQNFDFVSDLFGPYTDANCNGGLCSGLPLQQLGGCGPFLHLYKKNTVFHELAHLQHAVPSG